MLDMGTSRCGRYLNTRGSGQSVSDFALVHYNEGVFTWRNIHINGKPARKIRLSNGGHGQKGMDMLKKYSIEYHILKTYPNGVRVGYLPDHCKKFKRSGTGQAWFPKTWTEKDIRRAGEHVAGLKANRHIANGVKVFGIYKGVRVGIMRTNGKIATVFPDSNQAAALKRRKK